MPESIRDRCTKAHEYVFLLAKPARYYFSHESMPEPENYDGRRKLTPDGVVLDPFMGAGTAAVVARELGRSYLGIKLNAGYMKMAEERAKKTCARLSENG